MAKHWQVNQQQIRILQGRVDALEAEVEAQATILGSLTAPKPAKPAKPSRTPRTPRTKKKD